MVAAPSQVLQQAESISASGEVQVCGSNLLTCNGDKRVI
jgi:hypothetical protein